MTVPSSPRNTTTTNNSKSWIFLLSAIYLLLENAVSVLNHAGALIIIVAVVGSTFLGISWVYKRVYQDDDSSSSAHHPIGTAVGRGVSQEARGKWTRYEWGSDVVLVENDVVVSPRHAMTANNYGSMSCTIEIPSGKEDCDDNQSSASPKFECSGCSELIRRTALSSEDGSELIRRTASLSEDDSNETSSCAICLCEYELRETVVRLPCGHMYHESCINSWTKNHVRCPLCNQNLMEEV